MTPPTGKRQAFYVDATLQTEHGFIPSVVTEGEPGHTPMLGNGALASPWYWGNDLATARRIAARSNAALGLTESDVRDVVASSFRASEAIAEAGRIIHSIVADAISYDVADGDGWFLRRVNLADGSVIDQDDSTLAIMDSAIAPYLSQIDWGARGDQDADTVLRVDVRTGRWLRES
ncbi:hypothetical protein [Actinoplanes sp. NBRC 103695]|uniref:hypothetical protein n=1 Tax=Actinoplanes sp. NBRC 103695 TaxID=3032202 RepID=UPI0024A1CF97|nr:hypothetical protein [Actinoplanes sp. NBRC 103695]GLZ00790.1 hypothetical protein Acsp02_80420 [Actinoplanes sp. NBRC 103695]